MKRKLLFAIVALLCSAASWGITAPTASTPSVGNSYYLYNPKTEKFLARNGGDPYVLDNGLEWILEDGGDSKIKIRLKNRTEGYFWGKYWSLFASNYSDYSSETLFSLTNLGNQIYKIRTGCWGDTESYVYINTANGNRVACNSHEQTGLDADYTKWQFITEIDYIKYQIQKNASVDLTCRIVNPSFEHGTNNFNGWTNSGMSSQDNSAFYKTENKYAEAYQPNGTKNVSQTLSGLPVGYYTLSARCLARSVTSAKIFANSNETPITIEDASSDYSVEFTCDGSTDFNIGFEGTGTGESLSWIAVDNFTLSYTPYISEIADDYPSGGSLAANKWYKLFIPTAGNYDVTSTDAATIYYSQDGTTAANQGTALTFTAAEKKSISLSVGYLYIRSSAAQTLTVDTRFYLATTVNAETKWLNKNASGYTYAYDKGLPFTLESNNGNVVLKFSEGHYLNDVGSNWQTKAEGSKNNDWKLSAVDGGYKLLLGVNNACQLFIKDSGTGLVEITHSTDDGNVWRFVRPEDALASAIATAEAHTLGFEDGEYAPYNNTTPIAALATAKDATTNDARISAYAALTDATWTANVGEVNAIYWEDYTSGDIAGDTYIHPLGWTNTGYNTRIYSEAAGNKDTNNGISAVNNLAMMLKYNTTYGETTGYTMPLKAATIYKITFKYCGWNNTPTTNVVLTDPESNYITLAPGFRPATSNGHTNAENWYSYTGYFVSTTAGNYILAMNKVESGQQQIAIGDIDIRTASALEFLETGSPAYAAGTYPSVTLDRTFASTDRWYTLCAPFAFSKNQFEEVKVLKAVVGEGESAHMKFVDAEATVAAGTPCLVKPASADATLTATDVAMNPATTAQTKTVDGINFIGTFSQVNLTDANSDAWVVSNNNLYNVDSNVTVGAYRAYFTVGSGSLVKALSFDFGDATGIDTIANGQQPTTNGPIYNLAGQRVNKAQRGIYIVNGKKVLVK